MAQKVLEMDAPPFVERVQKRIEKFIKDKTAPETAGNQAAHCTFEPKIDTESEFAKKQTSKKPFVKRCYDFKAKLEQVL